MDYGTAGTALTSGILFGYVLEQAGFGSPCKLTAQFRLTDWSVFKVMFTAILVAAVGILILQTDNSFGSTGFYVPHVILGAVAVGGALIGAGFAVGGFCPGTAVVGAMSGRMDGFLFAFGMVAGIWLFSGLFETAWIQALLNTGRIESKTVPALLGISPWLVVAAMAAMAWAGFRFGSKIEQRSRGVYDAEAITADNEPGK